MLLHRLCYLQLIIQLRRWLVHPIPALSALGGEGRSLLVVYLFIDEGQLPLESRYLSLGLIFIKSLLGDKLATKLLDLEGALLLDGLVLFTHDVSPDVVEFVENLGDASLGHLRVESLLNLFYLLHSLSWYPFIGVGILLPSRFGFVGLYTEGIAEATSALAS